MNQTELVAPENIPENIVDLLSLRGGSENENEPTAEPSATKTSKSGPGSRARSDAARMASMSTLRGPNNSPSSESTINLDGSLDGSLNASLDNSSDDSLDLLKEKFARRKLLLSHHYVGRGVTPRGVASVIDKTMERSQPLMCYDHSAPYGEFEHSQGWQSNGFSKNHADFSESVREHESRTAKRRRDPNKSLSTSPLAKNKLNSLAQNLKKGRKHLHQLSGLTYTAETINEVPDHIIDEDYQEVQKYVLDNADGIHKGTLNHQEDVIIIVTKPDNDLDLQPIVSVYEDHPMYSLLDAKHHVSTYPFSPTGYLRFKKTLEQGYVEIPQSLVDEQTAPYFMTLEQLENGNYKTRGPNVGIPIHVHQSENPVSQNVINKMQSELDHFMYNKMLPEEKMSAAQFRKAEELDETLGENFFAHHYDDEETFWKDYDLISRYRRHIAAKERISAEPYYIQQQGVIKKLQQEHDLHLEYFNLENFDDDI